MPSDSMDDIELKNIQLQFPTTRSMSRDDSTAHEETVETDRGPITVAVQGCKSKPAIITYHDLGLNCKCFGSLKKNDKCAYLYSLFQKLQRAVVNFVIIEITN